MSRLSEDILSNVDIVDVVSRYVQLKRVGRNFVGLSPFRNEKTPSFTVSPEKQIFKCFSTGIGGNVIKFLMEMEKLDYRDAAQILAKDAGLDLKTYQTSSPEKWEKEGNEKEKYKLMLRVAQQYFVEELGKSAPAGQYLREKRSLTEKDIHDRGLGYAPDSSYGLPKLLAQKGFTEQDCITAGLAKKGSSGEMYGFYRNRITFPIYDHMGNIVGFGARALHPDDQPKYLNSPDSPLYDKSKILYGLHYAKEHLKTYDKLVIVEGYMDVIAWSRLGMPIAIGTCGTSLTQHHLKLLKRYTQHVYFMFDNDPAGIQATARALKIAYQHDVYPKLLALPGGFKDVDEWANTQPTNDEIAQCFSEAKDSFIGYMNTVYTAYDMGNPVERKRFLQSVFELLLYVQDRTILSRYIESVSKKTGIGYDVLFSQFKTFTKTQTVIVSQNTKAEEQKNIVHKENDITLFQAFFYGTWLQQQGIDGEAIDNLMVLVVEVAGIIEDNLLLDIVSGDVSEKHEELLQAQLQREKHWETLTPDKKTVEVTYHCHKYLHDAMKRIIKMANLSPQEKQDLVKRIQKVG